MPSLSRRQTSSYTRVLLFSTVFDLMNQVVCGIRPIDACRLSGQSFRDERFYQAVQTQWDQSVYISSALVGYSATRLPVNRMAY